MVFAEYREINAANNNLLNPGQGSQGDTQIRLTAVAYADGSGDSFPIDLPNVGTISDLVVDHPGGDFGASPDFNALLPIFGQFVDHDIVRTATNRQDPIEAGTIPGFNFTFNRSVETNDPDPTLPREFPNGVTAYLDASMVYGSTDGRALALRDIGTGKLLLGPDGLLPTVNGTAHFTGDVRSGENAQLTALHTVFVREHNRWVDILQAEDPDLSAEDLYQTARAIVAAEIQAITYREYLPALLGENALAAYTGYDPLVNVQQSLEFSTAAFRHGHSMVAEDVPFSTEDGTTTRDTLASIFFRPQRLENGGLEDIVRGMGLQSAQLVDNFIVDSLRTQVLGTMNLDLAALNILRGRDHGLDTYAAVRAALGLGTVSAFSDITSDAVLQQQLSDAYGGDVQAVDLWIGILSEDKVSDSMFGIVGLTILVDQFERLRDGDRFWYETYFADQPELLELIETTTLNDIFKRNLDITHTYRDSFALAARQGGDDADNAIVGSALNDLLIGFAGNDLLEGRQGNDDLYGDAGDDILRGHFGIDHLFGGAGDDRLDGGGLDDVLTGGTGSDLFLMRPGSGHDVVTDFELPTLDTVGDRISVWSYKITYDKIGFLVENSGLRVLLGDDSIFLEGFEDDRIGAEFFAGLFMNADAVEPFDLATFTIETFDARQDFGTFTLSSDGSEILLENNAWKQMLHDVSIEQNTMLRFSFASDLEGEIHGIGFETDGMISRDRVFQLHGTQRWGIQDFNDRYTTGSGAQDYVIPVGQFLRGDFDRIVYVMDDDQSLGADSVFADVALFTQPEVEVNGTPAPVSVFDPRQDRGTVAIAPNEREIRLENNAWKQLERAVTITEDTVLRFNFAADVEGEIHGIGFETDDMISRDRVFQLHGTQRWGIQAFNDAYVTGSGLQSYEIPVGQFLTGDFDRIVLVMDDDLNLGADSLFGDLLIV